MQLGAWVVAMALAIGGTAPRPDARRVLLLIDGERDRELAARVEGQVADLDIAVVTETATLPPDPEAQLAVARARAAEQRAEAVVWFRVDGGAWVVRAAQGDRVLVRRVGPVAGELSASAAIEAVGLVVRTELRGLAAGGRIGDGADPGGPPSLRPWGEVGWVGLLDGGHDAGHHGVVARGGVATGRWRAAATVAYHPAAALGSSLATLGVGRLSAGVVAGVDVLGGHDASRWRLGLELGATATRFSRSTTATGAALTPTASASAWSPVVAPSVRGALRLTSAWWLALSLGAELVLRRPEFVVATAAGLERVSALRLVEPRATLSVAFDPF